MKRILFICVTSQSVINFRKRLILDYKKQGYSVSVIAFDDEYKSEIISLGVNFFVIEGNNRNTSLLKSTNLIKKYKKCILQIKPDIVFNFMIKPNIFGTIAAKKANVEKIYCMVEGAGDVFIKNEIKWKIIRIIVCLLYKYAFKYVKKVFFLNNDDAKMFCDRKLVTFNQICLINGIGVDLNKFTFQENNITNDSMKFGMIARMLKSKGIIEYCQAAEIVKKQYPDVIFKYLGAEGDIKVSDIQNYIDNEIIEYCGFEKDVRPFLKEINIFVLPSYREGMSVSIMEAEAIGRPVITTNNIGCKDSVLDGFNGFLTNGSPEELSQKMIYMCEHLDFVKQAAFNSRKFAEENFDVNKINKIIIEETTRQ